jgi:hypothetical protein
MLAVRDRARGHLSFEPMWNKGHAPLNEAGSEMYVGRQPWTAMSNFAGSGCLNSIHIHGTHVPVEEPSTASQADIKVVFGNITVGPSSASAN